MKLIAVCFFIILSGCEGNIFGQELKCIDGKVFIKERNVWIYSRYYGECKEIKETK